VNKNQSQNQEIDYRLLLKAIVKSKFLIISILIGCLIFPFLINQLTTKEYKLEFTVELASKKDSNIECSADTFGIYFCERTFEKYSSIYSIHSANALAKLIANSLNKSNLEYLYNSNTNRLDFKIIDGSQESIIEQREKILKLIEQTDEEKINLISFNRKNYYDSLNNFKLSLDDENIINNGLLYSIDVKLTNLKSLHQDDAFIKSQLLSNTKNKVVLKGVKFSHVIASLIFGFIISITLVLIKSKNSITIK